MLRILCVVAQSCRTVCDPMDYSLPGFSVHGNSPGKSTRVSCHALLQGIFPTQGLNPGVLHCRQILYHCNQMEPHSTWPLGAKDLSGSSSSSSSLCVLGRVRLFATPWTVAHQAPLSMASIQSKNTGGGCHFLFLGLFLTQGLNPCLLHWQADFVATWAIREVTLH